MNRRADANHGSRLAIRPCQPSRIAGAVLRGPYLFDYPLANDRLPASSSKTCRTPGVALEELGIGYLFYLRRFAPRIPMTCFYRLAAEAAAVVTDDYPTFLPAATTTACIARSTIPTTPSIRVVSCRWAGTRSASTLPIPSGRRSAEGAAGVSEARRGDRSAAPLLDGPPSSFHTQVTPAAIPALVSSCEIDHSVHALRRVPWRPHRPLRPPGALPGDTI